VTRPAWTDNRVAQAFGPISVGLRCCAARWNNNATADHNPCKHLKPITPGEILLTNSEAAGASQNRLARHRRSGRARE
jgi:hypothetical protein